MYYYNNMNNIYNLTQREEQTLALIVAGNSNPEIAKMLKISLHTVKAHTESIYRKLNVHNKVQAAVYAVINQIV